ncbi:MAG: DUF4251 domain-containing protein [Ginsengibacter sp.]
MKTLKRIIKPVFFFLIVCITCSYIAYAQGEKKEKQATKAALIKNLIDSQNFVFVPQSVLPLRGTTRQLTSYYDIVLSKDSLVSYLPYFGRSYSAPSDPTDIGFNFTSTKFEYTNTPTKKGGWDILVKPKDYREVKELSFRIFDNGSASLNITPLNRDPISFQGYIKDRKQRK